MDIVKIAWKNIKKKKFKSVVVFLLIFLTGFGIFGGKILCGSLENGLKLTKDRMGSDMIVVPKGFVSAAEDALFNGKACTLIFDKSIEDKIASVDGVDKVCSQLYIASLNAGCCDVETQLVAIDIQNDFVVGPWLLENNITELKDDEIILGSAFDKKTGDTVKYFNKEFRVAGLLEETGGGYDKSAFITYDAAYQLADDEKNRNQFSFTKNDSVASMIHIKLEDGADFTEEKEKIESQLGDDETLYSITSKLGDMANEVGKYKIFGVIFNVWNLCLVGISLLAINTITIYNRRNEIGSMLTVGISKNQIATIFVVENLLIMAAAVFSATIFTGLISVLFKTAIKQSFGLPFVMPGVLEMANTVICILSLDFAIIACSMVIAWYWIYKQQPAQLVREVG